MTGWLRIAALAIGIAVAWPHRAAEAMQDASDAGAALAGVAFDERLDRDPLLLAALPRSSADLPPLIVRIAVDIAGTPPDRIPALAAGLERRVSDYAARGVKIVIDLGALPATDGEVEGWQQALRSIAENGRGRVAGYQTGRASKVPPSSTERYVFLLKLASVQLRSIDRDALVIQGGVSSELEPWEATVLAAGIAPYIDALAVDGPAGADDGAFRARVDGMTALVAREDASAAVLLGPIPLTGAAAAAAAGFFEAEARSLGTAVAATSYAGTVAEIRAALAVAGRAADLLSGTLVAIEDRTASLRLSRGGVEVTPEVPHRLLFSTTRFSTYLVYGGVENTTPLDVEVVVSDATAPQVRDAVSGSTVKPLRVQTGQAGRLAVTVPVSRHALILDFHAGAEDRVVERVEVQKERLPSVAEIIARHQQAQAAQDAAAVRYIAHMRIEQHFHPNAADPAYNIITENRVFFDRGAVEWEELSFEFNGAKWTANRPSFPLVQPEKVLSLPLDLRLTEDYRYRLDGVDTVMGRPAFVVRFEPVAAVSGRALYRGTVWIDRERYLRLKVQALEAHLTGVVVSNEETSTFAAVGEAAGRSIWLLDRLSSKQTFLIAGRTVLVEREARMSDVSLNPDRFEAERTEARASNRIMYRDTDQGLRYLVKKGGSRVVSDQLTTSTRAFALGAQVDPSFDYPLPIGGLDVLDFNFLHRDMQFALLFAGVFAAGNVQKANLLGGKVDASVDFFGLAVGSNDAVFDAQGERKGERVRRVPASTGVNVGFQATPFQKILGHYEFRFDGYFRDPNTAADFTLPASAGTHGVGVGYEYRRQGYSIVANLTKHRRTTAAPWGNAGALEDAPATFTQYDAGVSKDFIFATFHTIHLNGTYLGGSGLDRFSMYEFGLFDAARMHGVPSAVRFGELALLRGSYSFNLFNQYRLDLFLDHARGRDPAMAEGWLPVTGLGLGLNLRTPGNTILRADLGKSFLPDVYRGAGSVVLQLMLLKPL